MKTIKLYSLLAIIFFSIAAFTTSCVSPEEPELDKALLAGKWQSSSIFQVYSSNGTGYMWDTADDVTEEEAQPFTWTLEIAILTQIHIMESGGKIPKTYTVTTLTTTELSYEDDFGKTITFKRVTEE